MIDEYVGESQLHGDDQVDASLNPIREIKDQREVLLPVFPQ